MNVTRKQTTSKTTTSHADTILFDIPGAGPHTITPLTPLPDITDAVYIDGDSDGCALAVPCIIIDGTSAAPALDAPASHRAKAVLLHHRTGSVATDSATHELNK